MDVRIARPHSLGHRLRREVPGSLSLAAAVRLLRIAGFQPAPLPDPVAIGRGGPKWARRDRTRYHFTDGFVQDLEGELTTCRGCRQALRVAPVVMVHDENEKRRFTAVFSEALGANN